MYTESILVRKNILKSICCMLEISPKNKDNYKMIFIFRIYRNCYDIMFYMLETGQYSAFISLGKSLFYILHGTWYAAMSSLKITKT